MKFEFQNLEIRFHKRQVSFLLVVKTILEALNPNFLNLTIEKKICSRYV